MIGNHPGRGTIDFGLGGPIPRDFIVIMGTLVMTYALSAFETTRALIGLAQLSRRILHEGFLWQLVTYPFASAYGSPLVLILSLWMILSFGRPVYFYVGRKAFWQTFFGSMIGAGVMAVAVQWLMDLTGLQAEQVPSFGLMQAPMILITVFITGFATLYGHATILWMFILPMKASWFIAFEILIAFLAFLSTKDLAGFLGICTAVAIAYFLFSGVSPRRFVHEARLRIQRRWFEFKLRRLRKKGGNGGVVKGPWVH